MVILYYNYNVIIGDGSHIKSHRTCQKSKEDIFMSQFRATRTLFLESVHDYQFPLTYEAWASAPADYKAVLLFVNFFDQIELAWYNERFSYGRAEDDDAVSEVLQYLMKNVPLIEADPKRFKPAYIYRVAANCISCVGASQVSINHDKLEVSNEVTGDDGSVINLYDLEPSEDEDYEVAQARKAVWAVVDRMGPKAQKVVNKLINPTDALSATRNKNIGDKLQDISVSKKEYDEIMAELRVQLADYADVFVPISIDSVEGDSARDKFIREIDKLRESIDSAQTEKAKKEGRKALKRMRQDLALYDMLHTGYAV